MLTATRPAEAGTVQHTRAGTMHSRACSVVALTPACITVASVVLGALAAVLGGPLESLGSGAGGLGGFPLLVLAALTVLVGLPAGAVAAARAVRGRERAWRVPLILLGLPAFALAYLQGGHLADPCAAGAWTLADEVAGAPLCDTWGGGVEIDDRFHLLLHGLAGIPVAAALPLGLRPLRRRS